MDRQAAMDEGQRQVGGQTGGEKEELDLQNRHMYRESHEKHGHESHERFASVSMQGCSRIASRNLTRSIFISVVIERLTFKRCVNVARARLFLVRWFVLSGASATARSEFGIDRNHRASPMVRQSTRARMGPASMRRGHRQKYMWHLRIFPFSPPK